MRFGLFLIAATALFIVGYMAPVVLARTLFNRKISTYGDYKSTVHLGKSEPRRYDRYDIFSD